MFEGVRDVILELSKKYILIINTTADSVSTKKYLKENDLDFFERIYGIEISRNKIEKFKMILNDYGTMETECIFITDTVGDVKDSLYLNIPTLLVSWGYQDYSHFHEVKDKVLQIVDKPEDLIKYIKKYEK